MTSSRLIWLFLALRWVVRLSYWSPGWNVNRNWQNQEKPEYLLLILVQANFSPPQFFHPLFAFPELTGRILGSKPHPNETDIFSNWQKGHSSSKGLGPIERPPCGPDLHPQCKSGYHPGIQWRKHRVFPPRSYWCSPGSWPERWITRKASPDTRSGRIESWRPSFIHCLLLSAFGGRRWSGPTRWIAWPYLIDLRPHRWAVAGIDFWLWGY